MEPLVECYVQLQQHDRSAVALMITDTWLREYQTLPGRTHPVMTMPSSGGYLLSGIYVGRNANEANGNPFPDHTEQVADKRRRMDAAVVQSDDSGEDDEAGHEEAAEEQSCGAEYKRKKK